ncbi:MAG TPA: hypothetical protein VGE74_02965 [Gemmata sp.]
MSDPYARPPESQAPRAEAEREPIGADRHGAVGAVPRTPIPPRWGRTSKLVLAALVLVCGAGGALGSKLLRPKPPVPVADAAPEPEEPPPAPAAHPAPLEPEQGAAERIDLLIHAGSFTDALQAVRDAPPGAFGDGFLAAYREGLCLEGLGRVTAADTAYQRAEKDPNVGGWARAALGRARCALAQGSRTAARELIDQVVLRSGHPECRGGHIYEEALHLLARVALLESGPHPDLDALSDAALAWPVLRAAPDKYLDWLPLDAPAASPHPSAGRDVVEVLPESDAGPTELTVRLTKRPALDVIRAIASAAELEVQLESSVAPLLLDPVGPVEVERLPFDAVLAALTERAGVAVALKGGALHLMRAQPAAGEGAPARALSTALAAAPKHPEAGSMRVALANLDARAGRFKAAEEGYKYVLDGIGNAPEATHAAYNLGLMELRAGARNSARARFLEVIDRSPHTRFADLGWCWIGRTYLDSDDPGAARTAYRTALNGTSRDAASAAALAICACELLTGNEDAARALLEDTRFSTREPHAMLVNFYTALLYYRSAPTESRYEILLRAIRSADEGRGIGPGGVYLVGRVYAELGLPERFAALYEKEVETARGPLALRMLYDTAERYYRLDARKLARTGYLTLAAVDPNGLGALAEVRLAALDARDGNGAETVRRCWELVGRPGVPEDELLAVMGRGYELQKMYGAAAECFAGRLPK